MNVASVTVIAINQGFTPLVGSSSASPIRFGPVVMVRSVPRSNRYIKRPNGRKYYWEDSSLTEPEHWVPRTTSPSEPAFFPAFRSIVLDMIFDPCPVAFLQGVSCQIEELDKTKGTSGGELTREVRVRLFERNHQESPEPR